MISCSPKISSHGGHDRKSPEPLIQTELQKCFETIVVFKYLQDRELERSIEPNTDNTSQATESPDLIYVQFLCCSCCKDPDVNFCQTDFCDVSFLS